MKTNKTLNVFLALMCIFMVCVVPALAEDTGSYKVIGADGKEKTSSDTDEHDDEDENAHENKDGSDGLEISDFVDFETNVDDTKKTALWTPYQKITALIVAVFVGLIVWSLIIRGIKFLSGNGESVSDAIFGILGILGVVLLVVVALNSVFSFFEWSY